MKNKVDISNFLIKKQSKDGIVFPNLNLAGSKEDIFDNFLVDLFTNNLDFDLKKMGLDAPDSTMALDKSLILTDAKRQSMEKLLLTESNRGAFSGLDIRDGSAAGPSAGGLDEIGIQSDVGLQPEY